MYRIFSRNLYALPNIKSSRSVHLYSVGAGIHVFNGVPKGSVQNNEPVTANDSDSMFHLRFFCRSDSMSNNAGELIGLHNSTLTNSHPFNISTPQPGELLVFVDNHTRLTPSHQGVYTCHISMENGDIKKKNIGVYPSGFNGKDCKWCRHKINSTCLCHMLLPELSGFFPAF